MLTLQARSIIWSLNHALEFGDTDVFPPPFEFEALRHYWDSIQTDLVGRNVLEWITRPARTLLSPKAKYGFRVVTQLDPIDFLIYSSLVYEISGDIEARRIPIANEIVFSYRVATNSDGQLFNPDIGYRTFLDRCRTKLDEYANACFVAMTDISDFYSRIYHHRLENALRAATTRTSHVNAIMRLLSGWNGTETFGIPVGCAASRLLAEITLSDIDEALLAAGIDFVRFNDDYRIFSRSTTQAYQQLAFLAESLFKNHGLSLQPQKTSIKDATSFRLQHLSTPLDREMDSLHDRFESLVEALGLESWYDAIDYSDLTEDQQAIVDSLNLVQLFQEEAATAEPDMPVIRFCLRRLSQLGDAGVVDSIFQNLESITPAFADVMNYFSNLRYLDSEMRIELGRRVLELLDGSIVSELTYHRMWIVQLFTTSREWDNENCFLNLYNREHDQACKRKLILAMGRSQQIHWFQSQWRTLFEHPHWQRRALLAAASCMPPDARRHWYRSIEPQLDILERAVIHWAREIPFSS